MKFTVLFKKSFFFLIVLLLITQAVWAQEPVIELGKKQLPINEYFTISLKVRGQAVKNISDFPEIEGFKKSNRTRTKSRITMGNKFIIEEVITQNYAAYKEGEYKLNPFTIQINGLNISSKGSIIRVGPMSEETAVATDTEDNNPPVVNNFEFNKSQSFLTLETHKNKVYVGEGVHVLLSFLVALPEQGLLDFYDFANQYSRISKQLKQEDTWEEPFDRAEVTPDTITLGEKQYLKFKLYESVYFPLNAKHLVFPAVSLIMAQRAKDQEYALPTTRQKLIGFNSVAKKVMVQPLPSHPLRESVPVGQFRLRENIDQTTFKLDKNYDYSFEVLGTGNLAALNMPELKSKTGLDIYQPTIQTKINKLNGQVQGSKRFKYTLLAKSPGNYQLGDIFNLIYFNPVFGRYDTLRSELTIKVAGREENSTALAPEEMDEFYKLVHTEENQLSSLNKFDQIKLYTNVIVLFLICVALFLVFKK